MFKYIFLVCLLILTGSTYAQKKANTYFLKNDGKEVDSKDSADYIRIIEEPDSGSTLFNLKEYYKDGTRKRLAKLSALEPALVFEGQLLSYYPNGKKKELISYQAGKEIGFSYQYFENGMLYKKMEKFSLYNNYDFDRNFAKINNVPNFGYDIYKIHHVADSLGKVVIADGSGYLVEQADYLGENFIEKGNYVEGFRVGLWRGRNFDGLKSYKEYYAKGIFKRGVFNIGGKEVRYSKLFTAPNYKYTNNHIAQLYLEESKFYQTYVPHYTKTNRPDYLVGVTLDINENGNVDKVIFDESRFNKKVEEHIIKLLLNMPRWKPATLRGQNVKAKYSCLIPFFRSMG